MNIVILLLLIHISCGLISFNIIWYIDFEEINENKLFPLFFRFLLLGVLAILIIVPYKIGKKREKSRNNFKTKNDLQLTGKYIGKTSKGYILIECQERLAIVKNGQEVIAVDLKKV